MKKKVITLQDKLINMVMTRGKKSTAVDIVNGAYEKIRQSKKNPDEIFTQAFENVAPVVEVKAKRIGGSNYQIPIEVKPNRRQTLALRWLIGAARDRKGHTMADKLAAELMEASQNQGGAIKKKEDTHRMAEANKAFAHFAKYM
ncbi:MAG: 30S ribosomal protein S7 [Candidatus Abawacabacteria bacterium RBG_16_42_10]|uniref:Small ribosomal subunit protein uS7 n=1 Tax=Candidatus Abawacabacteria bacterium RBG_16_42_10 TaxID=1817814 RepID=A0A1F4XK37_9BACT|nr:MAG: 30S ribosomal protein S7 [Candidatus Abawacabacteria bacterium RBG_16_42_10]